MKNIKLIDGTDPLDGDIQAGGTYDFIYDGTNMVLQSVAVRATSADITAGTSNTKYPTVAQMVAQINSIPIMFPQVVNTSEGSTTADTIAVSSAINSNSPIFSLSLTGTTLTIIRFVRDTSGQYYQTHSTTYTDGAVNAR